MKEVKQHNDQSNSKQQARPEPKAQTQTQTKDKPEPQPTPQSQPSPSKPEEAGKSKKTRIQRQLEEQQAIAKLSTAEQDMLKKLQEIAFGTWFEFDHRTAFKQLKLAWFSRVSKHYMFVDHAGIKQSVETHFDLAKGLCDGSIRIIEPTKKSFMERALETILFKLKGT